MDIKITENKDYINSILSHYPFFLDDNIKDDDVSIRCNYAGEIRMGPPYYEVEVFNNGQNIFKGSIYGGEIFCENILSKKHNRLILVKWFSAIDPFEQVVVSIDLTSGKEDFLTTKGRYFTAGHFDSFDGIFYSKSGSKDTHCENFETNEKFLLNETLEKDIKDVFSWGLSPVKDTIIVITTDKKENVILYNLKNKKIEKACTINFELSENGKIRCFLDKKNGQVLLEFSDYDVTADRMIINDRKRYQILEF